MKVAIVKYNAGNVCSVSYALQRIGINPIVTDNSEELISADKVIFPGVGEASSAMHYLQSRNLDQLLISLRQPVLGICLGMQLMCSFSEENSTNCLGIFSEKVRLFETPTLKVPQIGWNSVARIKSLLFDGIAENDYFYFVHSYFVETSQHAIATTHYGVDYSSALQKDNFYAVQFHPEKSGKVGQRLLENFIRL
ncbi:MAG: imidazole glycerol phosphate synthase subunit HisH [Paludibacteraceae bacterium]|nr:imidazole glycerol phosphate synthase subunit HisH [Paludibacteraceae bacterium]